MTGLAVRKEHAADGVGFVGLDVNLFTA